MILILPLGALLFITGAIFVTLKVKFEAIDVFIALSAGVIASMVSYPALSHYISTWTIAVIGDATTEDKQHLAIISIGFITLIATLLALMVQSFKQIRKEW